MVHPNPWLILILYITRISDLHFISKRAGVTQDDCIITVILRTITTSDIFLINHITAMGIHAITLHHPLSYTWGSDRAEVDH